MNYQSARKRASDYAMALDLLSKITYTEDEQAVIENILELFRSLFSPQKLSYISLINGHNRQFYPDTLSKEEAAVIRNRMADFSGSYAWTTSGQGFWVRISHKGRTLGILEADQLSFPEYREQYLNLALSIIDVCALTIENARKYQIIKDNEKQLIQEKEKLEQALSEVKILSGLLPICSHCHNIRNDEGYWQRIEEYIQEHSDAKFSHSICRECAEKYYPGLNIYED